MKHKVIEEKTPEEFTPFTIQITAESVEELQSLWHRFCAGVSFGNNRYPYLSTVYQEAELDSASVWEVIQKELSKYEDTSNDY